MIHIQNSFFGPFNTFTTLRFTIVDYAELLRLKNITFEEYNIFYPFSYNLLHIGYDDMKANFLE